MFVLWFCSLIFILKLFQINWMKLICIAGVLYVCTYVCMSWLRHRPVISSCEWVIGWTERMGGWKVAIWNDWLLKITSSDSGVWYRLLLHFSPATFLANRKWTLSPLLPFHCLCKHLAFDLWPSYVLSSMIFREWVKKVISLRGILIPTSVHFLCT